MKSFQFLTILVHLCWHCVFQTSFECLSCLSFFSIQNSDTRRSWGSRSSVSAWPIAIGDRRCNGQVHGATITTQNQGENASTNEARDSWFKKKCHVVSCCQFLSCVLKHVHNVHMFSMRRNGIHSKSFGTILDLGQRPSKTENNVAPWETWRAHGNLQVQSALSAKPLALAKLRKRFANAGGNWKGTYSGTHRHWHHHNIFAI